MNEDEFPPAGEGEAPASEGEEGTPVPEGEEEARAPEGEAEAPAPEGGESPPVPGEEEPAPPPVERDALPSEAAPAPEPEPARPPPPSEPRETLISLRNLKTWFFTDEGTVKAVDGVSYDIYKGKTLGVVGESGCGKSVTALSILRLIPDPPGRIVEGEILFEGRDLVHASESAMRKVRGNDISMIFQEPMTSLNPVFTVGDQIMEAIILHQKKTKAEARAMAIEFLTKVGIPSAEVRIDEYPHQMSGGMKQRVMIAMALSCYPKLLIADEPSTALDVTIQAQILDLMKRLQGEFGMSILLITHDLGVVAEMADDVVVMYASKIAESGTAVELFKNPMHPYTIGLFKSIPHLGAKKDKLDVIPGVVPNPLYFPSGCKFRTRCPLAWEKCMDEPPLEEALPGHLVACWCKEVAQEKLRDGFASPQQACEPAGGANPEGHEEHEGRT